MGSRPTNPRPVAAPAQRSVERSRAAKLARHYRDEQHLTVAEIARLLGRAPATISAYLYDPDAAKAKQVKARYRGVCRECGARREGRTTP